MIKEKRPVEKIHDMDADKVCEFLEEGKNSIFLTLGYDYICRSGTGSRRSDYSTRTKTFERSRHRDLCGFSCEPGLLKLCKEKCEIYNSAEMTLEEVLEVMVKGHGDGKEIVRLHTGEILAFMVRSESRWMN